jgi:hypothetical protein
LQRRHRGDIGIDATHTRDPVLTGDHRLRQ